MAVDCVVIGAGLAGSVAARRAVELGATTALLEKGVDLGGTNSAHSAGVIHIGYQGALEPREWLREYLASRPDTQADPVVVDSFLRATPFALAWISGVIDGVGASGDLPWQSNVLMPFRSFEDAHSWRGGGTLRALDQLHAGFAASGGRLIWGAKAIELLRSMETGRICGVAYRDHQSGTVTVLEAASVILADGGYQANPRLVRSTLGAFADKVRVRAGRGGTGDAMTMAESHGARTVGTQYFYGHLLHLDSLHNDRLWPYPILDKLMVSGILVDRHGTRFFDEQRGGIAAANVVARSDDPLGCWVIFDELGWNTVGPEGSIRTGPPGAPPPPSELQERGAPLLTASNASELAVLMGVDPERLAATVAGYNAALSGNGGAQLGIPRTGTPRPLTGLLFAVPTVPGITQTMGGLAIDGDARVIDVDGRPIAGLYAAGGAAGGLHGGSEAYVGGVSSALVLGYIAGATAVRELV